MAILHATDYTCKRRGEDSMRTVAGQLDVVLAGGYTVLDNGVFEVAPFMGVKGFFRGYWLSEIVEDDSWNGVLRDETRAFNFFSEQISLALGIDIQIKSKRREYRSG